MAKIGFVGMGNMGYAMLKGVLKENAPSEIIFSDVNEERSRKVQQETGVHYAESNAECVNNARYIILAVKPQFYDQVLKSIQYTVTQEHVVISIAPGITIEKVQEKLGHDIRIVRAMPNTPALLGEGMTGISYDSSDFRLEEKEMIHKIFSSFGKYQKVDEKLMNAVVCVSGSSPAYVYMFIEALADSAVKYGIPREQAYEFAAQAVKGSAEMVLKTKEHPAVLKDQVCSPGGTTIAGVAALEEHGFRNSIIKAADACHRAASLF
ncbi:MAG: pyrroline-5-carboxylate reductase [Lachnospiraceae bacterium]|nr:pyrroline-5-carboxylate reductase [Lachnospiraceae bacterium]